MFKQRGAVYSLWCVVEGKGASCDFHHTVSVCNADGNTVRDKCLVVDVIDDGKVVGSGGIKFPWSGGVDMERR